MLGVNPMDFADTQKKESEEVKNRWMYEVSVTDRTNIVCFAIVMIISVACIWIAKKMKLPIWKLQIAWILLIDAIGAVLLITRISNG